MPSISMSSSSMLSRFEQLVSAAPSDDRATVGSKTLDEALVLAAWTPVRRTPRLRIHRCRVRPVGGVAERAVDERLSLLLDRGGGADLVSDIEAAVRDQPLNERRCGALVVALYRAGRQADALAALRRTSARLRDELGLTVGPEFRDLERTVLNHDPSLLGPVARVIDATDRSDEIEAAIHSALSLARARAWDPATRLVTTALETARSSQDSRLVCQQPDRPGTNQLR